MTVNINAGNISSVRLVEQASVSAPSGSAARVYVNNAARRRLCIVDSAGVTTFIGNTSGSGTGITFPSTQDASSDANTLDDYEEGTWTPVVTSSTGGTASATGVYTKIGRFVQIQITRTGGIASGTLTGNITITGLPFTASGSHHVGALHIRGSTTGVTNAPFGIINGTILYLHSGANYGETAIFANEPATYPATNITQNGTTSIVIGWTMTYFI